METKIGKSFLTLMTVFRCPVEEQCEGKSVQELRKPTTIPHVAVKNRSLFSHFGTKLIFTDVFGQNPVKTGIQSDAGPENQYFLYFST
ncbi:MAG: hypothetical protein MK110_10225 [Fuerstiella sp.]|nr:hypothetical protein [Fuerstiella sp.]